MPAIPNEQEEFEQPPLGTHPAICSRIVDLGTQTNTFQGDTTQQHQIAVFWELPHERTRGGLPFQVVRYYGWSMHPKANLRKDLESWRGRAFTKEEFGSFDIKKVLGVPCQVIIGESQSGKAKVTGVAGFPKGMPAPKLHDAPIFVWLSPEDFDETQFALLSDYWRDKIKASPEWDALHAPRSANGHAPAALSSDLNDEIPF